MLRRYLCGGAYNVLPAWVWENLSTTLLLQRAMVVLAAILVQSLVDFVRGTRHIDPALVYVAFVELPDVTRSRSHGMGVGCPSQVFVLAVGCIHPPRRGHHAANAVLHTQLLPAGWLARVG